MAKKRSGKSARSRPTKTSAGKSAGTSRPKKRATGPKQRSCDVPGQETGDGTAGDASGRKTGSDAGPTAQDREGSQPRTLPSWILPAVAAGLSLAALVIPWEKSWFGAVLAHPSRFAPWLDSPPMLGALAAMGLLTLATCTFFLLSTRTIQPHDEKSRLPFFAQWAIGLIALIGLAVTAYYNESLNLGPFAGAADHLWGIPLAALAALAGGVLITWKERTSIGIRLLTWTSALLLLSALVPTYQFGNRHIALGAALARLGRGGAQSVAGLAALATWFAAGLGLWLSMAGRKGQSEAGQDEHGATKQKRKKGRDKQTPKQSRLKGKGSGIDPVAARRIAQATGWLLVLAAPATALAAALTGQTGIRWFLEPPPQGANHLHLMTGTGAALAALVASWSIALAWAGPGLAGKWATKPVQQSPRNPPEHQAGFLISKLSDMENTWFWAAAILIAATFVILELQAVGYTVTDENIYYYQAMLVAQGKMPYKEFFFAHPPFHILIPALLFRVFGFHLLLAKAISITAGLGAGIMVLLTGKRLGGRLVGLAAAIVYLFSFAVLNASINMTGMNLTVFFLMTGIYLVISGRPGLGGLAVGAAMSTGFYSAAAGAALLVAAFLRSLEFGLRFTAGLFAMWGGVNLVFWALSGSAFLDGVYRYHGKKLPQDPRHLFYSQEPIKALFYNIYVLLTGKEFKKTMFYHAYLLVPWLVASWAWIALKLKKLPGSWMPLSEMRPLPGRLAALGKRLPTKNRGDGPRHGIMGMILRFGTGLWSDGGVAVVWLVGLALIVEFSMFHRLYSFYFVLWYPFMALGAAWLLVTAGRALARAEGGKGIVFAAGLIWLASLHPALANWGGQVHKSELSRRGQRVEYPWRKAGAFDAASPLVKALFWRSYRLRAEPTEGIRQFLWNKKRHFDEAPEIARYIREHTRPEQTIAGSSAVAPLLALLAHRHVAAEIVDTNSNRFHAGLITEDDFYRRICNTDLAYLVSAPMSFFSWRKMRFHRRFLERFRLNQTFLAKSVRFHGVFPVRLLANVTGATSPPYCRFLGRPKTEQRRR